MKTGKLISLILSPVLLLSCSDDISTPENNNSVSIEIKVPKQDDLKTRAYGDGSSVNNLKCYVYAKGNGASGEPIIVDDIPLSTDNKAFYSIQLPEGQNYDFVFLATSGEQENTSGKIYYNRTDRTFNVNYGNFTANDESVDCFMGTIQNLSNAQTSYSITLKRPFAQLNIGTKDLDDYNSLSVAELSAVDVSVDGVYSSMNVMNGNVIGSKTSVSFPQVTSFSSNPFPVPDSKYLSMSYLLMNTRENTTVTMKTTSSDGSNIDYSFNNIPLQRNFKTNIYGNLLTKSNDYKVEISPDFTGQENIDVNTDYDLVVKLVDNYKDWSMFGLKYYDKSGEYHSIDLLPYVDSDRIIQVNWSELGLENVDNLCFVYEPYSQYSNPMSELIKMNISPLPLKDVSNMFEDSQYVTNFDAIKDWKTGDINNMSGMFMNCQSLKTLNIGNWHTGFVTDMSLMFADCSDLEHLDLSNWNTSKVKDMGGMFNGCTNLIFSDLSRWDTSNVENMAHMFSYCNRLTTLKVPDWNVEAVISMGDMFSMCSNLETLIIDNWTPKEVTNVSAMFSNCGKLKNLKLIWRDAHKITTTNRMFNNCGKLEFIDMYMNTSSVTNMAKMFSNCTSLEGLDLSHWDTSNVTTMEEMFNYCPNLTGLTISNWDTSNVENVTRMFFGDSKLERLDLDNWNLDQITTKDYMVFAFSGLTNLTDIKCKQSLKDWLVNNYNNVGLLNYSYLNWHIVP